MAYLINEGTLDRLLKALQNGHARALTSPYWNLVRNQPEILEIINAADGVDSEARRNREAAPNVIESNPSKLPKAQPQGAISPPFAPPHNKQ